MPMTTYNAKDLTVTYGDMYLTGFGETMAAGSKSEDMFEPEVGAQGDVCVSEKNNPLGEVVLTFQKTSPSVKYMIECAKAGKVLPLWLTNKSTGMRKGGTQARILNYPEDEDAATAGELEFTLTVFDYTVEAV